MKDLEFPFFKTKIEGVSQKFNLSDPEERRKYFEAKAGEEIQKLREYLKEKTFIVYLMGKKNAGKGTYSKLFKEIVEPEKIEHFSVGDMIREVDSELEDKEKKEQLISFLKENYRGFLPLKDIVKSLEDRNTKVLLPTELILILIKREIAKRGRKTLFIDGFPRNLDQISYSLFFRDLIEYREDPDIFVLIDIPESVINERIKSRVICPKCGAPRNRKLFLTKEVGYNEETKEFYLICDNPECGKPRMVPKEGDELGISLIRSRLSLDEELIKKAYSLHGVPKLLLRNHISAETAKDYVDDYEITPEYSFEWDEKEKKVRVIEKPFKVLDDNGILSHSLLAPAVVVSLIKQMAKILNL